MRYIQAAVSDSEHWKFRTFASERKWTMSDFVTAALNEYIERRQEAEEIQRLAKKPTTQG